MGIKILSTITASPQSSTYENPLSAAGDIIYGGVDGVQTRLAKGTNGQLLTLISGLPAWANTTSSPYDLLSTLTSKEISITEAATATLGKMHVCSGINDYTVTLPAASGNEGKLIGVRMASGLTKLVTIDGNASELIDGATTRVMWANEVAILLCDGVGWSKIAGKSIPMIARMYKNFSVSQNIANLTVTKVNMDTAEITTLASMIDSTNFGIRIKRPGSYDIQAGLCWNNSASYNHATHVRIHKNREVFVLQVGYYMKATLPEAAITPPILAVANLAANDFLELYCYHYGSSAEVLQLYGPSANSNYLQVKEMITW